MCKAPELPNGDVSPSADSSVGIALTFECDPGYHLSTSTYTVVCTNNEGDGNAASYVGAQPSCGKIALMF